MVESRNASPLSTFLRSGLFALLVVSPLPFGSVTGTAVLMLELWVVLLAAGALWLNRSEPVRLSGRLRAPLLVATGLLLLGALQLVPWPGGWSAGARARAMAARFAPGLDSAFGPASLSAPQTTDALLRLVTYVLVAILTLVLIRRERHVRQGLAVVLASASFQAAYGVFEYLTGRQQILGYAKRFYLDEATGTFINRNHFAGYLALALPFALGLLALGRERTSATSLRERLASLEDPASRLRILALVAACLIWIGILLSYSRGALASAFAATALLAWTWKRRRALLLALPALVAALLLFHSEVRAPGERLLLLDQELTSSAGRLEVWRASLGLAARHPILGSGLGTFEGAFETVKPAAATARWEHAHNDWIEAAVTGGMGYPVLLALLLFLALRRPRDDETRSALANLLPACAAASLVAAALGGCFDFSARIPAYALLLSFVVGLRFVELPSHVRTVRFRATP